MTAASAVKKTYDAVSLFAIVNMLVVGGLFVYAVAGGALDAEKLRGIASVLRGDEESDEALDEETVAETESESQLEASSDTDEAIVDSQMKLEMMRRESDRIKEELRQRLALNNAILLKVTTERESFRAEREAFARQDEAKRADLEGEGFAKQVAILESLKPKTALQHLLGLKDAGESANVLRAMKTRSAQKIVAAAKGGMQMTQMIEILQRIRETAPSRSAEIEGE